MENIPLSSFKNSSRIRDIDPDRYYLYRDYYTYMIVFPKTKNYNLYSNDNIFYVGKGIGKRVISSVRERMLDIKNYEGYTIRPRAFKLHKYDNNEDAMIGEKSYISAFRDAGYRLLNKKLFNVKHDVDLYSYINEFPIYILTFESGYYGFLSAIMCQQILKSNNPEWTDIHLHQLWSTLAEKYYPIITKHYKEFDKPCQFSNVNIVIFLQYAYKHGLFSIPANIHIYNKLYTFNLTNIKHHLKQDIYFI